MNSRVWALACACIMFFWVDAFSQESLALDSCGTMVRYYKRHDLAVVPVMINDTLQVNMLLDPRCKSVILFGKRFEKLMRESLKNVNATEKMGGQLFLNNTIEIGPVKGRNIAIAVTPNRDPMNFFLSINGVIGYDLLKDFNVVKDQKKQILTFVPKEYEDVYTLLPVKNNNAH